MPRFATAFVACFAALLAVPAAAQSSDDELSAKATGPAASPMSFQLADRYQTSFRDVGGNQEWAARAAIVLPVPQ